MRAAVVALVTTVVVCTGVVAYLLGLYGVPNRPTVPVSAPTTSSSPIVVTVPPLNVTEVTTSIYTITATEVKVNKSQQRARVLEKVFGTANPTLLDVAERLIEVPEWRNVLEELVDEYGAVAIEGAGIRVRENVVSIGVAPLRRPGDIVRLVFTPSGEGYSINVTPPELSWKYRNLTEHELEELLKFKFGVLHREGRLYRSELSQYENCVFLAAERNGHKQLIAIAWREEAIKLDGFEAHRGIRAYIFYSVGSGSTAAKYGVVVIQRAPD